jgi:hypothetical protein
LDWILKKVSLPHTWEKRFVSEYAAENYLASIICSDCQDEMAAEHIRAISTGCGCEFIIRHVEDENGEPEDDE